MNNRFLVSTQAITMETLALVHRSEGCYIYADQEALKSYGGIKIIVDGYVLPRNDIYAEYMKYSQHELIAKLYNKFSDKFTDHTKGFFCLLIIDDQKCIIVNDIHSVKRCYIIEESKTLFISNHLPVLREQIDLQMDPFAPAFLATFQHFTHGRTPFKHLKYSPPASFIRLENQKCYTSSYFNPDASLVDSPKDKTDQTQFIDIFKQSIQNCIEYLSPANISSTLTGGRDTRSILSVLLSLGIKPHCFTFGFPSGSDVVTARDVADACNLPFSNHYIEDLNHESYGKLVGEIISKDNPFIHIHRAHRLDAIKKEKNKVENANLDMVFVGAMGGDYIKGERFNDYILTEFLRRYLTESTPQKKIIQDIFNKHYVNYDDEIIDHIFSFLQSIGLEHNRFDKKVEFNLVHNIIGCTHDIQDINVFMNHSKYVIAPFMDRDVMEALFTSPMSMFENDKHTKNPFKLLSGGELQCDLIKTLAPELADVKFANQYTPNDLLGNRLVYVMKRIYLQVVKVKSRQTFSYDEWFLPFVEKQINKLEPEIERLYDTSRMRKDLKNRTHPKHEGYWHKFTNPITLFLYQGN